LEPTPNANLPDPGKVALRKEDVVSLATKRIKPPCVGPETGADASCR